MSRDAKGMVEEAKRLNNAVPGIVVKFRTTALKVLQHCKLLKRRHRDAKHRRSQRVGTCWRRLAGAKYVAPTLQPRWRRAAMAFVWFRSRKRRNTLPDSMVLRASFKTRRGRRWIAYRQAAADYPSFRCVAQQMLNTPAVESAIEKFEQD